MARPPGLSDAMFERPVDRLSTACVCLFLSAAAAGASVAFVDATVATGLDFRHDNGMRGELFFSEIMGSGLGLLDYDGDGDLDLYLVQGADLERPNDPAASTDRLLRCDRVDAGTGVRWVDATARSGVAEPGNGMGVASADYDGDGDPDLYLTRLGPNRLLRNLGDGRFEDVTAAAGVGDSRWAVSASFGDYDGDGLLDLYVGNYVDYRAATHKECFSATGALDYCGPLAYEPEEDVLYRNRGDGTFENASKRAGIVGRPGGALGVVGLDFDGDGWLDFYVANDQVPNKLWINQRDGRFVDEALLAGVGVNESGMPEASMGLAVLDLTGDGREDIFVTHLDQETHTLYREVGDGFYEDATRLSGVGPLSSPYTGFGVGAVDFDLDGLVDLFVANGAVKRLKALVALGDPHPVHQWNQLFRGLGGGRFEEVSDRALEVRPSEASRGVAVGDVDGDGAQDLALSNNHGPARLLLNRLDGRGHWLGITVAEPTPETRVEVEVSGARRARSRIATDGSYASASSPRIVLGLGQAQRVSRIRIRHPSGRGYEFRDLPVDRYFRIAFP